MKRSWQICGIVVVTLAVGTGAGFILGRHGSEPSKLAATGGVVTPSPTAQIGSASPDASSIAPTVPTSIAPTMASSSAVASAEPSVVVQPSPTPTPARTNAPGRVLPTHRPSQSASAHTLSPTKSPTSAPAKPASASAPLSQSAALTWYLSKKVAVQQLKSSIAQVGGFAGLKTQLGEVDPAGLTPYIAQAAGLGGQMQAIENAAPTYAMQVALATYVKAAGLIETGVSDYLSGDSLSGGLSLGFVGLTISDGDQKWTAAAPAA